LKREKLRLLAAIAGVTFGVVLIFVQLGFQEAMFASSVRYHETLGYDIAVVSPKTDYIVKPVSFARNRLQQVAGFPGVASVTPVYLGLAIWRNPFQPTQTRSVYVVGFDPADSGFTGLFDQSLLPLLKKPDRLLFDRASREEFGPVAEAVEEGGDLEVEVNDRSVSIVGIFELGTSFGIDGSLLTSDLNFRRLFPHRTASHVDLGLIRLEPGVDAAAARDAILDTLPRDVEVLTRDEFVQREVEYWNRSTPIGYVFSFGVAMGLVVGMIIVYQILFSDVQDSLREYATLKAMGYTHGYLVGVVLGEATLLAVFSFIPAFALSLLIYQQAGEATHLPIAMNPVRAVLVFGLTLFMCCASAALAIRKLRAAQPAEIF
jgi:putative ABC transport system permease protein